MTSTIRYTEQSQRDFIAAVAQEVAAQVAPRAEEGPWQLARKIRDAIAVKPASDGAERHLCALIEPNDARAVVAADPDNLRDLADVMQELATASDTSARLITLLYAVAERWNTAMRLQCEGVLDLDPTVAFETSTDEADPAETAAAAATKAEPAGSGGTDEALWS